MSQSPQPLTAACAYTLRLRGDRKDVDAAADYIKKLVKRLEEENYSETVGIGL